MDKNTNTPAFTLSVGQLEESVKAWLTETIDSLPFTPSYCTQPEMAEKLRMNKETLGIYAEQGLIPRIKVGKSVRYCEQDVYRALKSLSSK